MLRGWKSASCNGFPAPSGGNGDVMEVRGKVLATRDIPILPNQLLRSISLISPPKLFNRVLIDFLFLFAFFYIVYFRLSKWHKSSSSASIKANGNLHGGHRS